ncbi:MAG: hypothetical protein WB821_05155 [Burkholderiaceae bacterium]
MNHAMYLSKFSFTRLAPAAALLLAPLLMLGSVAVQAQTIYRCPSVGGITPYTNDKHEADRQGCTPMTGGNVTIVQGPKIVDKDAEKSPDKDGKDSKEAKDKTAKSPVRLANAPQSGSRIDSAEQRSRDADSKQIFESELRKLEAKQAELLREFNNGEPDKRGGEGQNHQRYLDRTAEMKAAIARNDADIAAIKREIGRAAPTPSRPQSSL